MTETAFYVLPYPPSVNNAYRRTSRGVYKTKTYRQFANDAYAACIGQPQVNFEGPVRVNIALGRPDKRKRDLDNTLKPILDFLEDYGVIQDDSQVHDLAIRWDAQTTGAAVMVYAL